jgi:hypothetical protein
MAPTVRPVSPIGKIAENAGIAAGSPASPPSPPDSGVPNAVVPLPLNCAEKSTAVMSACTVLRPNWLIAAGLLTTTEASPGAAAEPANARPMPLTLFSLSWKPAACAGT